MNVLDRLIGSFSPRRAVRRVQARLELERLYDAAKSSHQHRPITDGRRAGDSVMEHARDKITWWARHLDENHDLVTGLLTVLTNTVARTTVEPMVRLRGGSLADVMNDRLADAFLRWQDSADWTGTLGWSDLVHLAARSWFRDGEVFVNHIEGAPGMGVPYQVELLESDFCAWDKTQKNPLIIHGVEKMSASGKPVAYHFYVSHPGNNMTLISGTGVLVETTRVPAENVSHCKIVRRLHQTRGVSILHPVVHRLDDLNEYESSERIAARVNASLCAAITRQPGFQAVSVNATSGERPFEMAAGQIFDLQPGENVETIGANRPNSELMNFRKAMLRAIASGTQTRYSLLAKDYTDGSYSSQRQELVESVLSDGMYRDSFCTQFYRPIWKRFVRNALLSGQVSDVGINPESLFDVKFTSASVPYIDIQKEVAADQMSVMAGFKSRKQVIRERGGNPREVDREREQDTQPGESTLQAVNDGNDREDSEPRAGTARP